MAVAGPGRGPVRAAKGARQRQRDWRRIKDLEKVPPGGRKAPEPDEGKGFDVTALGPVALIKVVLEDKERRQGGSKIVDPLGLGGALSGGTEQVPQDFGCGVLVSKGTLGLGLPIGGFAPQFPWGALRVVANSSQ